MALISVIVPVYNASEYLDECVASVLGQTYADVELILVDDASTDGSGAMCLDYARRNPDRVKSLSTGGGGVSRARNLGISVAKGEFIVFLDADDSYTPDALATMAAIAEGPGTPDIVVAQFRQTGMKLPVVLCTPDEAVEATLYQEAGFHESAWGKLYRRSLFTPDSLFAEGRRYEDLEMSAAVYLNARRIAVIDRQLYRYRINPSSFLNNWTDDRTDALWAVDSIMTRWGTRFPKAALSRRFSAYFNIFNLASARGDEALARRCWQQIKAMRGAIASDSRARLRNRFAALASLVGFRAAYAVSSRMMR